MLRIKLLLLLLLISCVPADKNALIRTNKNVESLAKNDVKQSEQLDAITDILIAKGDIPPEVAQVLKGNSTNILRQSNEILQIATEETTREVGIFNFGSFAQTLIKVAEFAKPWMGAISKAFGLPSGVGEGITALIITGVTAYMSRRNSAEKEAQRLAHEAKELQAKEAHELEVKKLNERMEIAKRMAPEEMAKYDAIKKQVRAEKGDT